MPEMKYDYLTAEERLALMRPRIQQLERDHFNVRMDVLQAGEGRNPAQETRLSEIEEQLAVLHSMEDSLDAEVKQRSDANEGSGAAGSTKAKG